MKNENGDVMLDLETWGINNNAVIIQIGACYFDRYTGEVGEKLSVNIDAEASMRLGFEADASTIYWWMRQEEKARASVMAEPRVNPQVACEMADEFLSKAQNIWSHATFDFVILSNHFNRLGLRPKFRYSSAKDIRTLTDLTGPIDWTAHQREGVHHDALSDCLHQVKYCVSCFKKLRR